MNQPVVLPCCGPLPHNPIVLLSGFKAVKHYSNYGMLISQKSVDNIFSILGNSREKTF